MTTLRDEILTGPLAATLAPWVASGEDNRIAEALNAPAYDVPAQITRSGLLAWAGAFGVLATLTDAAEDRQSPVRSQAMAALRLLDLPDADASSIDMGDTMVAQMFAALVGAGVISEQAALALNTALPTKRVSRAEIVLGHLVSDADIARALRG